MQHINQAPLIITGNGTTHVDTAYPQNLSDTQVISIYNSSTTVDCFALSGATPTATTSCQIIPFGKTRTFTKAPGDAKISIVFVGASTDKVYVTSGEDKTN